MATSGDLGRNLETALNVATELVGHPFTSSSQGIADVTGAVQVTSSNGLATPQYQVTVSNGTISFNTLADPSGNY